MWGVEDGTRRVVGTTFRPRAQKGAGSEDLEPWLARLLTPRIDFTIHEFASDGLPVVMFEVHPATAAPVRFKETEYIRVGGHKKRLHEHPGKAAELWATFRMTDFESGVARDGVGGDDVLDWLDHPAYFALTSQRSPDGKAGILSRLADDRLATRRGPDRFDITNLGAILFARDLTRFGRLGRKALRVVKYRGQGRVLAEREWDDPPARAGYAAGFEAAVAYINSQLPKNEPIGQALRYEARVYPQIAVRELVANTLIHQDFSITGAGPTVELFDDRMELTNPGEPLVDTQRFIDTPPRSRNEVLAGFMRRVNVCEERGSGIDKVIDAVEMYQLPPPDFRRPPGSTQVVLYAPQTFAAMDVEDRVRACYQHCVLCWVSNKPMTNATLRQRFGIADGNYPMVSRVIRDATDAGLIRMYDPDAGSRHRRYVPFWA